ncbi:hypothetical protein [Paenibacillus naphthalenovorans]|uniref:hypothetical protein n=1 Tax=Paenibacillus naphthalenovorans TaxID=162209 RepID=UPI003D2D923A
MNLNQLVQANYQQFLDEAFDYCISCYLHTRSTCANPQEPDFIATLVKEINTLTCGWEAIMSSYGYKLSITTVFCHQNPIVDYGSRPRPELGDLLLVHVHKPSVGPEKRHALLLQAKVTRKLTKKDLHQFNLYGTWPDFDFYRPRLSGRRSVHPKSSHNGAKYLFIDRSPYYWPFSVADVNFVLFPKQLLAQELVNLLTFSTGKSFVDKKLATSRNDWSSVIWDLLNNSFGSVFKRKNIGLTNIHDSMGQMC